MKKYIKFIAIILLLLFLINLKKINIMYKTEYIRKNHTAYNKYIFDGESKCYINYEYGCPDDNCSKYGGHLKMIHKYSKNLYDAVEYLENKKNYFNNLSKDKNNDLVFFIDSVCTTINDEKPLGYSIRIIGDGFEYFEGKYTFKEVYESLKNDD